MDINAEVRLHKRVTLFSAVRNITNTPQEQEIYGPGTATYARLRTFEEFGVNYSIGLKGAF